VWVRTVEVRDVRNIQEARLELQPGLNVLVGRNAQGKTSVLESMAVLARGRSFRTEDVRTLIRRGATGFRAAALVSDERESALEVEVAPLARRLRVDGRDVTPGAYQGRLEVVVYSTDRLKVVRGPMRERRHFLDRGAAALWPTYRQALRDYERCVLQRNAALDAGGRGVEPWTERLLQLGASLRYRRTRYVEALRAHLQHGPRPAGETYDVVLQAAATDEAAARERLDGELRQRARDEQRARRTLVGPHRDLVGLLVDGEEAAVSASSGQARSLLLALSLAMLEVYRAERGGSAVALLDDLDSELDEERATHLCRLVASRGQVIVTTAHEGWLRGLREFGRVFRVEGGQVAAA
jgi:DNA replication and repair protein RecF